MFNNSRVKSQQISSNSELDQIQILSTKLIELLREQAQKETSPDIVAVALLARAMDFTHYTLGKEDAKRLILCIMKDIQSEYDFKRN